MSKDKNDILITHTNQHFVMYCNNHLVNYNNSLNFLKNISPSDLKYSRKTILNFQDTEFTLQTSDVHIEIDFELLGVNEYSIFFDFFKHIKENMIKTIPLYVLCIHFNMIKQELLQVFHSFMNEKNIYFILLTDEISFLTSAMIRNIMIKKIKCNNPSMYNKTYKKRVNIIVNDILENRDISFFVWRENLYNLLIMNDNIHACFSYLFESLIENEYLNDANIDKTLEFYYENIRKYNNNYRSIYHLEHFITYLRNLNKNTQ